MKSNLIGLVFGLAISVIATPLASQSSGILRRALTPDNTCGLVGNGNNNGYTCDPNLAQGGPCCSPSGYCGSSSAYCGTGCQAAYGTCGTGSSSSSSAPASSPTGSTTVCGASNGNATCATGYCCSGSGYCGQTSDYCTADCQPEFGSCSSSGSTTVCGPSNGNAICAAGYCCSGSGYCGQTADYCAANCQPAFGTCSSSSTSSAAGTTPTGSTTVCGPSNGNAICAIGYCCSGNGYCGQTSDYCSGNCQPAFGSCGTLPGSSSTSSATGPGPTGSTDNCGPSYGNAVCATGLCCSPSGFCGTGEDYCSDPSCLYNFGTCDSDTTPAGTSTITDPRPLLGSVTYTDDIYDCVAANVVALTFDDGPLNYTNELLDVLLQFNFKATFFITGNNVGKGEIDLTAPYPDVIKRMVAEGHQVASHTWSHYDLSALTSAQRIQQMVKNERAIANIIGKYPTYMRPPYSSCDQASGCWTDLQNLGYHRTYFDLDTQDYLNPTPDMIQNSKDIVNWALGNATQGSDYLSIQHDIVEQSVANLSSYYFGLIQQKGWKGVTVGDCLGDPVANWYRVPGTGQGAPVSSSTTSLATSSTTTSTSTPSIKTSSTTTTSTASSIKPSSTTTTSPSKTSTTATTTTTSTKPTSTSKTTSTSSSKSTTTSKPTTTPSKTTTKSTTTTPSATTKITAATAPVATPQCDQPPSGTFCGKVSSFSTRPGCSSSYLDCKQQQNACSGKGSRAACQKWGQECDRLAAYCMSCGTACSDKGFRASSE